MEKKFKIPSMIIAIILIGGVAFYGGIAYGKNKKNNFTNQGRMQQFSGTNGNRTNQGPVGMGRGNQAGGFIGGEIISKDDNSLTLKLNDGGSKILFLSASTTISKMTDVGAEDLTIGLTISANGQPNSDGSINVASIQIRPAMPNQQNR